MTEIICGKCGIIFGVPEEWRKARKESGETFFCPNGDPRVYKESRASELEREKEEMQRTLQAQINEVNHAKLVAERERDKAIKEKRKVERRIAHGVCPCCNKIFANIGNHMVTDHPDFRLPEGKKLKLLRSA